MDEEIPGVKILSLMDEEIAKEYQQITPSTKMKIQSTSVIFIETMRKHLD